MEWEGARGSGLLAGFRVSSQNIARYPLIITEFFNHLRLKTEVFHLPEEAQGDTYRVGVADDR